MQKNLTCDERKATLERAFEAGLAIVLFFSPFLTSRMLWDRFDAPKILLLSFFVPVLLLLLLLVRKKVVIGFPSLLLLALSSSSFLAVLANHHFSPVHQPKVLYGTMRNPLSPLLLLLLALFSVAASNSKSASFQRKALALGFSTLAILSLWDFIAGAGAGPFGGRAFGFAGNPVYLGSILVVGAAYMLSLDEIKPVYRFPVVAVAGASIATTGTRVAILAFLVSVATFIALSGKKARILAASLAVPALTAYIGLFSQRLTTLWTDLSSRFDLYEAAILGVFEKPLTGHGFSAYEGFFRRLEISERYLNIVGEVPDSSHSAFLDTAFSSGIPSLFFLVSIFACLLFTAPVFALPSLVVFKFLPASASVLVSFVAASSLLASGKHRSLVFSIEGSRRIAAIALVVAALVAFAFFGFKTAAAGYYLERALEAYESRNLEGALRMLDASGRLLPHDPQAFVVQARILKEAALASGSPEPAEQALEKLKAAEAVDPFNYEVQILKTDVLSLLARKEALDAGNAAVFLSPFDANSYYYRGLARVAAGDLQGAVKDWQRAVELKENFADAYYSLGHAKEMLGDYESAERYYKMALKYAEGSGVQAVKQALEKLKGKR